MIYKPRRLPRPLHRADGKWEVRWRYKLAGKEHRPRRVFDDQATANDWILKHLVVESNKDPKAARQSFDAYADAYLRDVEPDLKPTSYTREVGALKHARAYFAGTAVSEIRASDCRSFRAALKAGGCTGGRKLKRPASVAHAYRVFRAALELAAEDAALTANPAARLRRKDRKKGAAPKFKAVFLDAGEVEALAAAASAPYGLLLRFLAYTGLRAGELAGLDVADVKLWKANARWRGYVDVHRTRRKVKGGWYEDTPKSERSTRRVELPPWLAEDVHTYLTDTHPRGSEPGAALFPNRSPGATYRTDPGGQRRREGFRLNWAEPVEPSAFYRNVFKKALAAAGLPERTRLHDLRHTFAALYLAAGGDIKKLSEQMGHEKYTTTWDFYAHLIPPDDDTPHVFSLRPEPRPLPSTKDGNNVVPLRPTGT